jgi:regulator of cell morphogenesis and NO signaling
MRLEMANNVAINEAWTVNEVIESFPDTIAVFNSFGVDSCCGGNATLAEAAADAGVDLNALVSAVLAVTSAVTAA